MEVRTENKLTLQNMVLTIVNLTSSVTCKLVSGRAKPELLG